MGVPGVLSPVRVRINERELDGLGEVAVLVERRLMSEEPLDDLASCPAPAGREVKVRPKDLFGEAEEEVEVLVPPARLGVDQRAGGLLSTGYGPGPPQW